MYLSSSPKEYKSFTGQFSLRTFQSSQKPFNPFRHPTCAEHEATEAMTPASHSHLYHFLPKNYQNEMLQQAQSSGPMGTEPFRMGSQVLCSSRNTVPQTDRPVGPKAFSGLPTDPGSSFRENSTHRELQGWG